MRKLLAIAIGAAVLVITPYFLFFDGDPEFEYGAVELCAAVEGTWEARLAPGAPPVAFTVEQAMAPQHSQRERGLVRNAAACSHRSLVKSAEACVDVTVMELRVTSDGRESPGTFWVTSTVFERGRLEFKLGDRTVSAQISKTGAVLGMNDLAALRRIAGPSSLRSPAPAAAP